MKEHLSWIFIFQDGKNEKVTFKFGFNSIRVSLVIFRSENGKYFILLVCVSHYSRYWHATELFYWNKLRHRHAVRHVFEGKQFSSHENCFSSKIWPTIFVPRKLFPFENMAYSDCLFAFMSNATLPKTESTFFWKEFSSSGGHSFLQESPVKKGGKTENS